MTQIPKISLNEKWRYHYASESEDYSGVDVDDSDWKWTTFTDILIPRLSPSDVIWLRKRFDLNPAEACVQYFLRCKNIAYPMTVYLRGQKVIAGEANSRINVDITNYVALEDNVIVLEIHADKWDFDLQNADINLQPILCDDLV